MNNNKKKALVSAILTIALCFSVIAGATFALFTSKDEVNIAVTSGKVNLTATIDTESLKLSSLGVDRTNEGKFAVGGTATFDNERKLNLTNIVPGDKATFEIDVTNNSNVDVMYKLAWKVDNTELDALVATATVENETEALEATDWIEWKTPATDAEKTKTIVASIELPREAGDDYQDKAASVSFTVEAVQANAVVDSVETEDQLLAALATGVENITLANSIVLTSDLVIPAGRTVTINLAGNTISATTDEEIINNGTLYIIDGTGMALMRRAVAPSVGSVLANIVNNGTMTISGGTIEGAITNNDKAEITVLDGTIAGSVANNGAMTVLGGEISSDLENNGAMNIVGGDVTGTITGVSPVITGGYFTDTDAIEINEAYFEFIEYDGKWLVAPKENVKIVASVEDLKGVAADVNNGTNNFSGQFVVLAADIDLANEPWTPIGNSENKFEGTFDGLDNTISNLVVNGGSKSYQGLFGFTQNGEIKNLKINNADVTGRLGVGVLAGSPYTSKYTNITLTGHVEVNGMSYVGGLGGRNAYANWEDITIDVDETSYVNANSVENGTAYRTYVGGVVGFMGEGGHSLTNVISNIDVIGSTCDVGGIVGIAHYGNSFFKCSSSGDVTITDAAEVADAEEMGGIAGVWNNGGADVTFEGCAYTGKLSANVDADLTDNTIVGAAYSTTGNGNLIIDRKTVVVVDSADELVAALESGKSVIFGSNIKIDPANMSNAYGTTGINVKNGQTIDGNGHILDVKGAGGTWDSGINTTGGIIKNLTVTGSFRGVFINHNSDHSETVVLDNVTIEGTTYTISCDQGKNQNFEATGSTFNGWTSYAATIGTAKFTDCSFGKGNGYAYCRPYAPTEFVGCDFEAGYTMDPRAAVTFENCTIGGVALTTENLATLVTNIANATVK